MQNFISGGNLKISISEKIFFYMALKDFRIRWTFFFKIILLFYYRYFYWLFYWIFVWNFFFNYILSKKFIFCIYNIKINYFLFSYRRWNFLIQWRMERKRSNRNSILFTMRCKLLSESGDHLLKIHLLEKF